MTKENSHPRPRILILDDTNYSISSYKHKLNVFGEETVYIEHHARRACETVLSLNPDVVIMRFILEKGMVHGPSLLVELRREQSTCDYVFLEEKWDVSIIKESIVAGASDFWVNGRELDVVREIKGLLERSNCASTNAVIDTGFLNSCGLTVSEINLLSKWCEGFHNFEVLSRFTKRSPFQIRKAFCGIYEKISLEGQMELCHLLTVLSFFNVNMCRRIR